jgi:AraC-like DNA-binding protein
MVIFARLDAPQLVRLRVVAGVRHGVVEMPSWRALRTETRRRPVDIVVADPAARGADVGDGVRALADVRSVAPVLVYTTVSAATTRAILILAQARIHDYVFAGFDDEPSRLRRRLEEAVCRSTDHQLMAPIIAALDVVDAPPGIASSVREVFRTAWRFRTAQDLAAAAGLSRQHTNAWLHRAGLPSCRTLVMAVRVLRGFQYAQHTGLTLADVAARLRYPDPEVLADNIRALTGASLTVWRARGAERLTAQLRARLGLSTRGPLTLLGPVPAPEVLRDTG